MCVLTFACSNFKTFCYCQIFFKSPSSGVSHHNFKDLGYKELEPNLTLKKINICYFQAYAFITLLKSAVEKKIHWALGVVVFRLIPAPGRERQADHCTFKAYLFKF